MKTYELFDSLRPVDIRALRKPGDEWVEPRFSRLGQWANGVRIRATRTNECRPPQVGEWYISGAIPQAYRAKGPMRSAYQIVKLVRARQMSYWEIIE